MKILLLGQTGSGKTMSLFPVKELNIKGLNPQETLFITCSSKMLPVKAVGYKKLTNQGGNFLRTDNPKTTIKALKYAKTKKEFNEYGEYEKEEDGSAKKNKRFSVGKAVMFSVFASIICVGGYFSYINNFDVNAMGDKIKRSIEYADNASLPIKPLEKKAGKNKKIKTNKDILKQLKFKGADEECILLIEQMYVKWLKNRLARLPFKVFLALAKNILAKSILGFLNKIK